MTPTLVLFAFVLFFLKHFIIDFPLQGPFQYQNKGTWGHPGGIQHAAQHGIGTIAVCLPVLGLASLDDPIKVIISSTLLGLLDGVIHYVVDWGKMNINRIKGWGPTTHEEFWWLLGLDQLAHLLTYAGLVWIML